MPPLVSVLVSDLSVRASARWQGASRSFLIARALKLAGYRVEMRGLAFAEDDEADFEPLLPQGDFSFPLGIEPCHYHQGNWQAVRRLLPQISGDILFAVKPKPSSFGIGLLKRLGTRKPLILDVDDFELSWFGGDKWQYRPRLRQLARDLLKPRGALRFIDHPAYIKFLERRTPQANAVTVNSSFLQQRYGGTWIPSGKDTELFDPAHYNPDAARRKYGLSDYRVLMFPGASRPYKGLEDVLEALTMLNQPDLRLVIVGGSPYDDYDQELRRRWGNWLVHLPAYPYQQMPEVISAAHMIVVPQRDVPAAQAQFPLKLTDGMAMGKPIMATRVGDIPNILADTGYLCEPESPPQLATQIQNIFLDWEGARNQGFR
ncbi:MAG: glycosyltransferase, partial [Cyanobacteria bacterium P01_H01_bin.15]